jgi:anti-anti-sigma factor
MPVQRWSDRIWVVHLAADPVCSEDLETLHEQAAEAPRVPDVVIDLSGVEHLNSSNLSGLIQLRKTLIERSARLRLAAPPDSIWALFLATGLDKVFEFATDTSMALADLQIKR